MWSSLDIIWLLIADNYPNIYNKKMKISEKNLKNINVGFIFFKENMLQRIEMCYIPSLPPWKEKIVDIKRLSLFTSLAHHVVRNCIYSQVLEHIFLVISIRKLSLQTRALLTVRYGSHDQPIVEHINCRRGRKQIYRLAQISVFTLLLVSFLYNKVSKVKLPMG